MKNCDFLEFFRDVDGALSFKRVQTAVFTVLFSIVVLANLFWGKHLTDSLVELLTFLLAYGYTGIAIEKFSKRGQASIAEKTSA